MKALSLLASCATLLAVLLTSTSAQAAQPGAYSVTETKSAIGNKPAKPPRTKDRCIGTDQMDKDGFLYPDQLLSQHFSQCRIKDSKLVGKNTKEWTVTCGKMLTAQANQVNTGGNFHLHIDAKLLGGSLKQTLEYEATSLKRACTAEDSPLD
ncbi:MAG: hypothetical protein RSD57_07120 [Comamonas sp.]